MGLSLDSTVPVLVELDKAVPIGIYTQTRVALHQIEVEVMHLL
jgi:hypothetical protein